MLNDYLGKSEIVEGIELFPISILEWQEFEKVAPKYLHFGYNLIKFQIKPKQEDVRPFDVIISILANEILASKNMTCESVLEVEKMFSLVTKTQAKLHMSKDGDWGFQVGDKVINRDNYDKIREVIMRQNLIFEPLIVEDKYTQKIIDKAIQTKNRGGGEFDFQAMIIYVCNKRNLTPQQMSEYTYYQLRCDNEMLQRIDFNDSLHHYRSQGAKAEMQNVYKSMETLSNPYAWDKFFTKIDSSSDKNMENLMRG